MDFRRCVGHEHFGNAARRQAKRRARRQHVAGDSPGRRDTTNAAKRLAVKRQRQRGRRHEAAKRKAGARWGRQHAQDVADGEGAVGRRRQHVLPRRIQLVRVHHLEGKVLHEQPRRPRPGADGGGRKLTRQQPHGAQGRQEPNQPRPRHPPRHGTRQQGNGHDGHPQGRPRHKEQQQHGTRLFPPRHGLHGRQRLGVGTELPFDGVSGRDAELRHEVGTGRAAPVRRRVRLHHVRHPHAMPGVGQWEKNFESTRKNAGQTGESSHNLTIVRMG